MWDFFKYFLIEGFSILAILICAIWVGKKIKPFKWKVFVAYYFLATGIELAGHYIGLWTWSNLFHIVHHALWWATILILDHYYLEKISQKVRFLILFNGIMTYQILQEWLVKFVTHYQLFGNEYNMIALVSLCVCLGCMLMSQIKRLIVR